MLNQNFTTNGSIITIMIILFSTQLQASKLVEILPVDSKCIVLHFQNGAVEYNWDDTIAGSCNGWDYFHTERWSLCPDKDQCIAYGSPLNTAVVQQISSFLILSKEDNNFGETGKHPIKIYIKSKVWEVSHDERKAAMHYWIYLELPFPLETGKSYTIRINNETNNHIPDIIDEALWEIDWWLRMRDSKGGYLTGLTNIQPPQNVNYAGNACAWQGWCVAAGCAMVADCFRLNNNQELQMKYTKEAINAYNWAQSQSDKMLDIDVSGLRGKYLRLTDAAFLYNLTGETKYEDIVNTESEVKSSETKIRNAGIWEQQFASTGYILTPQQTMRQKIVLYAYLYALANNSNKL